MFEKLGRSWALASIVLICATVLGGLVVYNDQRQWAMVSAWWGELAKWLVLGNGLIKAGQKGMIALAGKGKEKK